MQYDKRNGFYQHVECSKITGKNGRKIKAQLDYSGARIYQNPVVGKCYTCKAFDSKEFFDYKNRGHVNCERIRLRNSNKMKPHKTDTCAFTNLPFGHSETRPVGDHDHDTLLYRGHIWSAANRLEGAAKFIMDEAGWTVDELCDALKSYLAKPGIDIGLEPYPQLGFSTPEEAQQHYGSQI